MRSEGRCKKIVHQRDNSSAHGTEETKRGYETRLKSWRVPQPRWVLLGSCCPSPKFLIFQAHARAWRGHGMPGPPQQRMKLEGVPRRARILSLLPRELRGFCRYGLPQTT